jgi:hypothetical protein
LAEVKNNIPISTNMLFIFTKLNDKRQKQFNIAHIYKKGDKPDGNNY